MPSLVELQDKLAQFRSASLGLQLGPLLTEQDLARFGIEYQTETIDRLEQSVEQNRKLFFTGHTGCGKSTLLAELEVRLNQKIDRPQYFVVRFSISDTIEIYAVDHINILFSIAVQMLDAAERDKDKFSLPPGIRDRLYNWLGKHTKTEFNTRESEIEASAEAKIKGGIPVISEFLAAIKSKLKLSSVVRHEISTEFDKKPGDLIAKVDEISAEIEAATGKQVLVIIDDLDKLPLSLMETIFKNNIKPLLAPVCRIIYTLPIAILRDVAIKSTIMQAVKRIDTMPATKFFTKETVRKLDRVAIPEMLSMMEKAIEQRLPDDLLAPGIKQQIVLKSGGLLREMFRITDFCCDECIKQIEQQIQKSQFDRPIVTIDRSILDRVTNDLELDYSGALGRKDYVLLKSIYEQFEPEDAENQRFQELLNALYIVEYQNALKWYDLNPIVTDLLQRRGDI
jgi:energy-coupling factor transporter ATP-binding protein EcfA2